MGRLARSFAATFILWGIAGPAPAQFSPLRDDPKSAPTPSRKYTVVTAKLRATYTSQKPRVLCVAFSPDGTTVASADVEGVIHVWQAADGKLLHRLTGHVGAVNHLAFSPLGDLLISAGSDGKMRAWNPKIGKYLGVRPIDPLRFTVQSAVESIRPS